MDSIRIERCNSSNKDFQILIKLLDTDLHSRYGEVQLQYSKHNKIEIIDTVVVAYKNEIPVGCGCFKEFTTNTAEIKRMFVKEENRGQGIAGSILDELEKWAHDSGYDETILETGIKQYEAISFYQKKGYVKIRNYGQYVGNSNSICMRKVLVDL